jgi:hypothetical protein
MRMRMRTPYIHIITDKTIQDWRSHSPTIPTNIATTTHTWVTLHYGYSWADCVFCVMESHNLLGEAPGGKASTVCTAKTKLHVRMWAKLVPRGHHHWLSFLSAINSPSLNRRGEGHHKTFPFSVLPRNSTRSVLYAASFTHGSPEVGNKQIRLWSERVELLPTVDLWAVKHASDVRDSVVTSAALQASLLAVPLSHSVHLANLEVRTRTSWTDYELNCFWNKILNCDMEGELKSVLRTSKSTEYFLTNFFVPFMGMSIDRRQHMTLQTHVQVKFPT